MFSGNILVLQLMVLYFSAGKRGSFKPVSAAVRFKSGGYCKMIGLLGGTSLAGVELFRSAERRRVFTPYGGCDLLLGDDSVFIPRQGEAGDTPPHRINHYAHLHALHGFNVRGIVSFASTGSLKDDLTPGSLLLIGDYFAPFRVVTFHHDRLHFTVPGVPVGWSDSVRVALEGVGLTPKVGAVYAETLGPRFETEAEVHWLTSVADVVGMTCASEAFLAMELGIPHCTVAMVDNFANGIGAEPLSGDGFREQVVRNRELVRRAVRAIVELNRQQPAG